VDLAHGKGLVEIAGDIAGLSREDTSPRTLYRTSTLAQISEFIRKFSVHQCAHHFRRAESGLRREGRLDYIPGSRDS
jgi:hypothetical protein